MPAAPLLATIVCGGQRYTNWKSVVVRRDYGNWQSTFEFTASEPGGNGSSFGGIRLKPGDAVQILLGGTKVIDGGVTTRSTSLDKATHDLVIAGKSLTQQLTSSVPIKPGTYNGATLEQAAKGVMAGTGVGLVIKNPPAIASKPFASLCAQYGEGIGEFVERICKMRGLFMTDDEDGNLVLSQVDPGAAPVAELQEGRNILRAVCTLDNQAAWSGLSMAGQQVGTDQNSPPRDVSASVTGPGIGNGKTRVMIAEHPGDGEEVQQRVNFEAANAAWGQVDCQVTVVGWFKDDGSLWTPTQNVTVLSPTLFPSDSGAVTLGIQACVYAQDDKNGTTTTLHLKLPGSLTTLPNPTTDQTEFGGNSIGRPNQAKVDQPDTVSST